LYLVLRPTPPTAPESKKLESLIEKLDGLYTASPREEIDFG